MKPLHELSAREAARRLARRELSAESLARACLQRIAEREPDVRAFAHLDAEALLARARALDAGAPSGLLHGLPVGVKDLIDTADAPTTYGSAVYAGHRPALDAAVVARCREAGALMAGKTVSTEFAYFTPGPTRNPHHPGHTPGGSSSGSAAAVAAGMLPLALGTQTAGSIIRPAAYCGVVGFKPSHGRVPRAGIKSLSDSLDTVGGFARSVDDVSLLAAVLLDDAALAADAGPVPAPRIGLCRTREWDRTDADTQRLWDRVAQCLAPRAPVHEVELPSGMPDLVAVQMTVMAHEMARALRADRLQHGTRMSARLCELLDRGIAVDGPAHRAALLQRDEARAAMAPLWAAADILIAPSASGEAPAGLDATGDPLFCRGWTLLGYPCLHLPLARGAQGLPIGLQLVAPWGEDARLLAAARWCEQALAALDA